MYRHERRSRRSRLAEIVPAVERRARGAQRAEKQSMGLGICLQRLPLLTSGPQTVEPKLFGIMHLTKVR